jgi:eukaryotic-like serine/threonine-protein kinase
MRLDRCVCVGWSGRGLQALLTGEIAGRAPQDAGTKPTDRSGLWTSDGALVIASLPMESNVKLAPGALIDGRYVLGQPLGEGSAGTVYAAEHQATSRKVAIKLIPASSQEMAARFAAEIRAARSLHAPSIVETLDSGTTDGWHYLVYEYVDGPNLGDVLRARGALREHEALAVAMGIARALALAC